MTIIRWTSLCASIFAACLAGCSSGESQVETIEIVAFGILEFDSAVSATDPTSSVGARMTHARKLRIASRTDRIPIRSGLAYGVAFIPRGKSSGAAAEVQVILRSTAPCVLKETGREVHQNDTALRVNIDELRHIGGRIAEDEDSHCVQGPGPGTETFEFYAGGRKLAEKCFQLFRE